MSKDTRVDHHDKYLDVMSQKRMRKTDSVRLGQKQEMTEIEIRKAYSETNTKFIKIERDKRHKDSEILD